MKCHPHEFLFPGDILKRHSLCPLFNQHFKFMLQFLRHLFVNMHIIVSVVNFTCHGQKQPCIISGICNASLTQAFFSRNNCFPIGHTFSSFCHFLQSNTASTEAIPTSIISSSGSLVVIFCIQSPGLLSIFTNQLSYLPAKRINS